MPRLLAALSGVVLMAMFVAIVGNSTTTASHRSSTTTDLHAVSLHVLDTAVVDPGTFNTRDRKLAFQRVRSAGARYVRFVAPWSSIAPANAKPADFRPQDPGDSKYSWDAPTTRCAAPPLLG